MMKIANQIKDIPYLATTLKLLISIGLLYFIFTKIDFPAFIAIVRQAHIGWVITAMSLMILGVVLRAWRWQSLLNAIDIRVPITELTAIYFIGFLFNNVLPSGVGGDAIRIVELNKHSKHATDAVSSVLVDRFLGLLTLQGIGTLALLFNWNAVPAPVAYFTVAMFIASSTAGYLMLNRKLYTNLRKNIGLFRRLTDIGPLGKLFSSLQSYPSSALRRSYLISILFNLSLIAMNMSIGLSVGVDASFIEYAIFIPITSMVLMIPIGFGGLGLREGTYIELFKSVGVPTETALAMSLLVYTIGNLFTGLIGGIIYLLRIR
ncbi:lysylphosphatidylglycerol synthase transmembrane domain-containing protein [Anaerolineales bacterium HSG6]|nr:lysylphosphatidylglycerol synthase transmembrane domain-containing protein [Anaerolineales bacterium HSG6]MDM8530729.1 lysylphosphatidylglycerol synthase transmembrane domain-containing protein [Anaerolineales bacterium HSG25]